MNKLQEIEKLIDTLTTIRKQWQRHTVVLNAQLLLLEQIKDRLENDLVSGGVRNAERTRRWAKIEEMLEKSFAQADAYDGSLDSIEHVLATLQELRMKYDSERIEQQIEDEESKCPPPPATNAPCPDRPTMIPPCRRPSKLAPRPTN